MSDKKGASSGKKKEDKNTKEKDKKKEDKKKEEKKEVEALPKDEKALLLAGF